MAIYINGILKELRELEEDVVIIEDDTLYAIDQVTHSYIGGDKSITLSALGLSSLDIQTDRHPAEITQLSDQQADLFQGGILSGISNFYCAGDQSLTLGYKNYISPFNGGWVAAWPDGPLPWTLSGIWSTAVGFQNAVSGRGCQAYGNHNIIDAYWGTAIGDHNHLFKYSSRAFGAWNILHGGENMGYGLHNYTDQWRAMAFGNYNTVSALEGFAAGHWNKTYSASGLSIGWGNRSSNDDYALSIGTLNQAAGCRTLALGYNNTAGQYDDYWSTITTSILSATYLSGESTSGDDIPADKELWKTWLVQYPEMSGQNQSWARWTLDGDVIYTPISGGISIGSDNNIYENDGTAMGYGNTINASGATAIGKNITNNRKDSVELGTADNVISIRGDTGWVVFPPAPSAVPTSADMTQYGFAFYLNDPAGPQEGLWVAFRAGDDTITTSKIVGL